MAGLNWTIQALEDVEDICEFIAKDSPYYARLFASEIFDAVTSLKSFPESGRIVPEFGRKEVREKILGNYRIIYKVSEPEVDILAIYHSARLLDTKEIRKRL